MPDQEWPVLDRDVLGRPIRPRPRPRPQDPVVFPGLEQIIRTGYADDEGIAARLYAGENPILVFPQDNDLREIRQVIDGIFEDRLSRHYPFVGWGHRASELVYSHYTCTSEYFLEMRRDPGLFVDVIQSLICCLVDTTLEHWPPIEYPILRYRTPYAHEPTWDGIYSRENISPRTPLDGMGVFSPLKIARIDDVAHSSHRFLACVRVKPYGAAHLTGPWGR